MPRTLVRNLHMCFTKFKYPPSPQSSLQEQHQHQHQQDDHIHTPNYSPSNTILIKNFNTLYDPTLIYKSSNSKSTLTSSESDSDSTATPDFATVCASQRFFFSSPGRSNSIIESTSSLSTSSSSFSPEKRPEPDNVVGGGIPIPTFSPDPFLDFRQSMQEMVEARDLMDVRANWEYLHELLTCYLSLNHKSTHKFIVGAFADLLVSLTTSSPTESGRRRRKSGGSCEISRKCIYD